MNITSYNGFYKTQKLLKEFIYRKNVGIFPLILFHTPPKITKQKIFVNRIDRFIYSTEFSDSRSILMDVFRIYNKTNDRDYMILYHNKDKIIFRSEPDDNISSDNIEMSYQYLKVYEYLYSRFYRDDNIYNIKQELKSKTNEGLNVKISLNYTNLKYHKYTDDDQVCIYVVSKRFNKIHIYKVDQIKLLDDFQDLDTFKNFLEIQMNGVGDDKIDEDYLKNTKYLYLLYKYFKCFNRSNEQNCSIKKIDNYDIGNIKKLEIKNLDQVLNLSFELRNTLEDDHYTFDKVPEGMIFQFIAIKSPLNVDLLKEVPTNV